SHVLQLCCLTMRRTARSTLFPYTTLFRSEQCVERLGALTAGGLDDGAPATLQRLLQQRREHPFQRLGLEVVEEDLGHCRVLAAADRKSTRLNSSHVKISYAVFCLKKKKRV